MGCFSPPPPPPTALEASLARLETALATPDGVTAIFFFCVTLWFLLVLRLEFNMARSGIPGVPAKSLLQRFVVGHATSALRWRREGGVQGFLRECRDAVGKKVFWFRLSPFHANVVIGDAESVKFLLNDMKQERYRKGFLYDSLRVVVPRGVVERTWEFDI